VSQAISQASTSAQLLGFATGGGDDELIRLCAEIVEIESALEGTWERVKTIEDERRREPESLALFDRRQAVLNEIEEAGSPTSAAGLLAMGRAALALVNRDQFDEIMCDSDAEWLAINVIETLLSDFQRQIFKTL